MENGIMKGAGVQGLTNVDAQYLIAVLHVRIRNSTMKISGTRFRTG